MKRSEFERRFGKISDEDSHVNPLEELEHKYFRIHTNGSYQENAINECIKEKLSFHSTCNSVWEMMDKLICVKCPKCGKKNIPHTTGGGNGQVHSYSYKCPRCLTEVGITVVNEGINVKMADNE